MRAKIWTHQEGSPSRPIRTGHNQHTPTGNTRQPELNSRVPRVQLEGCHSELNSRNATCWTPIPSSTQGIHSELNSKNPTILPLKHHQKPCRSRLQNQQLGLTAAKSPRGTRTA